jgi:hypothetical protein
MPYPGLGFLSKSLTLWNVHSDGLKLNFVFAPVKVCHFVELFFPFEQVTAAAALVGQ